jgi:hypothetical protein
MIANCILLEDNGTHLTYALEKGTIQLKASRSNELVVDYEQLSGINQKFMSN